MIFGSSSTSQCYDFIYLLKKACLYINCCIFQINCSRTLFKMLQIHICERLALTASSGSFYESTNSPSALLTFSHLVHYVSTTSTSNLRPESLHHKFELTTQTSKNPINLVLSLSLSNCSCNQVECLSCCLSFCRMMCSHTF